MGGPPAGRVREGEGGPWRLRQGQAALRDWAKQRDGGTDLAGAAGGVSVRRAVPFQLVQGEEREGRQLLAQLPRACPE